MISKFFYFLYMVRGVFAVVIYSSVFLIFALVAYGSWLGYRGVELPEADFAMVSGGVGRADFVVFILFDGASAEVFQKVSEQWTRVGMLLPWGSSVLPSYSGPARASILSGAPPAVHGVVSNEGVFRVSVDNLVEEARRRGYVVVNVGDVLVESLFGVEAVPVEEGAGQGALALEAGRVLLRRHLGEGRRVFMWITVNDVDIMGHKAGGLSAEYNASVRNHVLLISRFLDEVSDLLPRGLVVVLNDHGFKRGGHHGGGEEAVMSTFMYVAGLGVRPGVCGARFLLIDVAPTVAMLLGWDLPRHSLGRPLTECFGDPGGYAAASERQRRQLASRLESRYGTSEINALFTDMWWIRLPLVAVAFIPPLYLLRRAPRRTFIPAALHVASFAAFYAYAVRISTFSDIYSFGEVVTKIALTALAASIPAGLATAKMATSRRDATATLIHAYLAVATLGLAAASTFLIPYGPVVTFPNPPWDLAVKYFVALLSAAFSGLVGVPTAVAAALAMYKNPPRLYPPA